jgi:hypothetical protein
MIAEPSAVMLIRDVKEAARHSYQQMCMQLAAILEVCAMWYDLYYALNA